LGGIHEEEGISEKEYEIIRTPTLRRDPSRASMLAMVSYIINSVFRGFLLIKRWKPEVIHVHFAVPAGAAAWLLSKLTGIPYVLTAHLGDVPGGTPEKTARWFRLVKPFTYPIWNDADQVIAVSQFTRSLAQKHYQVPIKVIHNGVDTSLFDSGKIIVHQPPKIVFAGRFVPQKNPILVIQTLAELDEYEWELVMLGDGPLYKETKEEAKKHGLEDRVKFPGWVHPGDVKKEFQQSDILFLPSKSEGLPVVGVQALASGMAFVVSDIGGFIDIVEHGKNGYLCDVCGLGSYIAKLKKLLLDENLLYRFRQKSLLKSISILTTLCLLMKVSWLKLRIMEKNKYKRIFKLLGTLISLSLFIYLINLQDWDIVLDLLDQLSVVNLLFVFLLYLGGMLTNGLRWFILLVISKIEVPIKEVFKITFVGSFVSNFLPSTIGGDGARFVSMLRFTTRKKVCLSSIIIDRLLNVFIMFLIMPFAIFTFIPEINQLFYKLVNDEKVSRLGKTQFSQLNFLGSIIFKIKSQIWDAVSIIEVYWKSPRYLLTAFLLSIVALLFSFLGTFILAISIDIDVKMWDVIQIASVVYVFTLIPISFNGLGIRELVMTTLYVSLGSSIAEATMLALITRLLMILVSSVGVIWLPEQMSIIDKITNQTGYSEEIDIENLLN
jgi:glycosyltransferase involved in cell wall biosynthesis/uncharacterized membrane protein YbhN (UPF0104 family)